MKKNGIFWGIVLIITAVLLIIDSLNLDIAFLNDIPVIRIALGIGCIAWICNVIARKKAYFAFFPLAFLFMLFESKIAKLCSLPDNDIISNWVLVIASLFLTIGFWAVFYRGRRMQTENNGAHIFSNSVKCINAMGFTYENVQNNMGNLDIRFDNANVYTGGATLEVKNSMGKMTVYIPSDWAVVNKCQNSFGSINMDSFPLNGKLITITGSNNMGNLVLTKEV